MTPSDPPPPPPGSGGPDSLPPPPPPPPADSAVHAPAEADPFLEPRRLHPASVVLGIPFGQLVQALIFPLFAGFAAGGRFTLYLLAIAAPFALVARILGWQRRRFSFDGEVLRVDSGVLSRSHRSLDVGRIQQVEIQRGPIQRLFGLAALRVETAGSASEPEADLRVLTESDAVALRAAVRVSKQRLAAGPHDEDGTIDGSEPPRREVLIVPNKDVLIASITGARLLVLPAVLGAALQFITQQVGNLIDQAAEMLAESGLLGSPEDLFTGPDWQLIVAAAVLTVVLAVVLAAIVGLVRDGNFRIERVDDDLYVKRGLLTTRESVVPLHRVQLVEVQRNWLRRLLGYSAVRIRSAGGSTGGDGRVTVPLIRDERVDALLSEVMTDVPGVPELISHPPAAFRRTLFRWLRSAAVVIAVLWIVPIYLTFFDTGFVEILQYASLALVPLNTALAIVEYRQLAHGLTEVVVASRGGALSVTTSLAPVVKVQAVTSRRNLFQRRLGLTEVIAHVAGPGALLHVLDADVDDAARLHERLTEHAASPRGSAAVAVVSELGGGQPETS